MACPRERLGSSSAIVCAIEIGIHPDDSARDRQSTQTLMRSRESVKYSWIVSPLRIVRPQTSQAGNGSCASATTPT
jgi:hypothetical protein